MYFPWNTTWTAYVEECFEDAYSFDGEGYDEGW